MKRFKKVFTILAMFGVVLITACGGLQGPMIPKSSIPADSDADVKKEIERLYSSKGGERGYGAYNLGKMGKRAAPAVPFLIDALKDEDKDVRKNAACALGEIKDPRAIEPLIAALKDKDDNLRRRVPIALGKIKDSRAIEPLIVALKDKDNGVREIAAEALKEITGKDFGQDPAKWQEWWVQNRGGQPLTTLK